MHSSIMIRTMKKNRRLTPTTIAWISPAAAEDTEPKQRLASTSCPHGMYSINQFVYVGNVNKIK